MAASDLTAARLREILDYSIISGRFYWREKIAGKCVIGGRAGCMGKRGVMAIKIMGKKYLSHRLAWLHVTGEWPSLQIDHIDTRPSFNAWLNLREATPLVNSQNNIRARPNSRTGMLGVFKRNRPKPFYAQIMTGGKLEHLGSFLTADEAADAYAAAKATRHPESTIARELAR